MHEMSLVKQLYSIALNHAAQNKAERILAIHLNIGEIRDIEAEWIERYFRYVSKGSIAEGARIRVRSIPAVAECEACGAVFRFDARGSGDIVCPVCARMDRLSLLSGREYSITGIEIC